MEMRHCIHGVVVFMGLLYSIGYYAVYGIGISYSMPSRCVFCIHTWNT